MNYQVICLFAICLVQLVAGENEEEDARIRLYKSVYEELEPPLERDELIKMFEELRDHYKDDQVKTRISLVLELSEVSEERCRDTHFLFGGDDFYGRENQLIKASQRLQVEVCAKLWDASLLTELANLGGSAENIVGSLIDSMVEANGGRDFSSARNPEMHYANAQTGVLRFMEQKSGVRFSKATKQDEFDRIFDKFVNEPCGRVVKKLSSLADDYNLLLDSEFVDLLDPTIVAWLKNIAVCHQLRAFGYNGNVWPKRRYSFRKDTFNNLASRL